MNMTTTEFNDLRTIANLAWGSGWFEGKKGGNGTLGLMRGPNGEPRVFKCLTHSSERTAFAKNDSGRDVLAKACDELRLELQRLATAAGMDEEDVAALFKDVPADRLLSRKIVARAVTAIGKANQGGDVWTGVTGAGTVGDTALSLVDDNLSLEKYGDKGFKALEDAALAPTTYGTARTGTAAAEQIKAGYIGDEWREALCAAADFVGNVLPKAQTNGIGPVALDLLIAKPAGLPLARPTFVAMTGHDEDALRPRLFQHELARLLNEHGEKDLTPELRKQIARQALVAAVAEAWVLKTLFDIAEAKGEINHDTPATDLLNVVVWEDNGELREEAIQIVRESVVKGLQEQADRKGDNAPSALYLRNIYLGASDLDITAQNVFDPDDDDGKQTQALARMGLNGALSFAWSQATGEMKQVFAATHDNWQGDESAYAVPTGQGVFNAPGKLYMTEFWMD